MLVHAHKLGSGPKKIMIFPGWMGDHTAFTPTLNSWNTNEYTIAFVDYRGYGMSKDIAGEFTIEEIAKDGLALADEWGWDDFYIVGHSMGGLVVQQLALLAGARVKAAVGITPVPASGYPMDADNTALFEGAVDNIDNRRIILDFTTGQRLSSGWLDFMTKASQETTIVPAYKAYLDAWVKTDISDQVKDLKTPFLAAYGEFDPAISKEMLEQTYGSWLENCEIIKLPNSGHYPMQETPVSLVKMIESFFENN